MKSAHSKLLGFRQWFGQSKVVDKGGMPMVVYHGTTVDFDTFEMATRKPDIGFHFGTLETSEAFSGKRGGRILPVYLKITNPLRLKDVFGRGTIPIGNIALQLKVLGILNQAGYDQAIRTAPLRKGMAFLRDAMTAAGYDGIVYENEFEGLRTLRSDEPAGLTAKVNDAYGAGESKKYLAKDAQNRLYGMGPTAESAIECGERYMRTNPSIPADSYIAFSPDQIQSAIGIHHAVTPNKAMRRAVSEELSL